ncbi:MULTISPECIES: nuclear transport factor 2 family protein [unclassified Streptomyces]|uniref:nuclear transport factor 2 family protein n=1 Tax=unclassified Streptomyces TaxID=2593676 RepID=UPI001CBBC35C|nr:MULTISPECIES: nuclear transport factor 2 family protein [unclassified Streptomyces]WPO72272.1 nuclear transport factor 2 family protein [Streptomyces sp. KN37]
MTGARTDVEQVELANTAFYEALERGDFDEVSDLWLDSEADKVTDEVTGDDDDRTDESVDGTADGDAISCVHPGWPVLTGRGEVLRSYALIMANTEYIQFFLTDLKVGVAGDTAVVTCTENILSGGPPPEGGGELGPLVGQLVVATNVFRRTPDGWKLWSHHASPVLAETDDDEGDETPS